MIRWAALVGISVSWVFAFHHFVSVDSKTQLATFAEWHDAADVDGDKSDESGDRFLQYGCVLVSLVLLTIGLRNQAGQVQVRPPYAFILLPIGLALLLSTVSGQAYAAYHVPLIVLGFGCVWLLLPVRNTSLAGLQSVGLGATVLGTCLVLQSPLYWLCTSWSARNPEVPVIGWIPYVLLKWLGSDVSYSGGTLYLRLMRDTHAFPLTWEHFAILPLLSIWVGGAAIAWWNRDRKPFAASFSALSIVIVGYAFLRLLVMLTVFVGAMIFVKHESDTLHVEIFWLPWVTAVSFLPLIPLLARFVPWSGDAPGFAFSGPPPRPTLRTVAIAFVCIACLGLVAHVHYWDPGDRKKGRVLLDEAHSRWERTDRPYDTNWYGHEAGYNYYCMAQYLRHYYDLDFNMEGKLTPEKLADYDVLILKTPTEQYAPEEIEAIEAFVRDGGGLFALGEHTNVFGSSVCLNPVTRRFGMAFRYDSVFDIMRKWEQFHEPTILDKNPMMQAAPFFRFAVSCSIDSDSWKTRPVIRSTGLWNLPISYAAGNFYPHVEDKTYAMFGAFNQMMCATAGKGRVAAFGDSTVYSNFLAFYPGKPELLLGTVEWLNRTNRADKINDVALGVFAVALILGLLLLWRLPPHLGTAATLAACAAAVTWGGIFLLNKNTAEDYAPPTAHTPVHRVVLDMQNSDVELPLFSFTKNFRKSYEVFYQFILRLGYYTDVTFDLERTLRESNDPIVIIKPTNKSLSSLNLADIHSEMNSYLQRGGALLILDSRENESLDGGQTDSSLFLRSLDFSFQHKCRGDRVVEPQTGASICSIRDASSVTGGKPLLTSNGGDVIAAYERVGDGLIIVAGLAERFTNVQMGGGTRTIPHADLRAAFELHYQLLRALVEKDPEKHMRQLGETYAKQPDKQ